MSAIRLMLARIAAAVRAVFGGGRADTDLRAELESHLVMHIDDNLRRGMSAEAARREALLAAGSITGAAELVREQRGLPVLETLISDIRYAIRGLLTKPAYTAAVVLTLALGIGANSAMFTIVNAVVLRPLPYPDPDRIITLSVRLRGADIGVADEHNYFAWASAAHSVALAAYSPQRNVVVTSNGPEDVRGMLVTASYFDILGVHPLLGRVFNPSEDRKNGPAVVVLGEHLWRQEFGGDSSIVGRSVSLNDKPATVVGVMPRSFGEGDSQFWMPYAIAPSAGNVSRFYFVVGRLRPGVSLDAARAELTEISQRVDAERPDHDRGYSPVLMTLHERRYGSQRTPLLLLFSAVGVLLLIACANLANLSLARAVGRQREMAVRLALGAGRWRLVRALLCESVLLSIVGASVGLALATALVRYMMHLSPASVGNMDSIAIDGRVLLFTLTVAVITGIVFGIGPAIAAGRGDLQRALSAGGPRSIGSARQQLARRVLVVAQLATALVLLTGAGLVARTFWKVVTIDPGFRPDGVVAVSVKLSTHYTNETASHFFDALMGRVRALPGVTAVSLADVIPLGGAGMSVSMMDSTGHRRPPIDVLDVGSDYFGALGVTVRAGRPIDAGDRAETRPVAVINTSTAHMLFGTVNPIGQTVRLSHDDPPAIVVGVVDDIVQHDLESAATSTIYRPLGQIGVGRNEQLLIRVAGPVEPIESAVTRIVQATDRALPPPTIKTMRTVLAGAMAPRRFAFVLFGIFAGLAVMLAAIGLYGVLAHLVAERTRELGVRVALGADPRRVRGLVLGQGVLLTMLGTMLGLGGSVLAVRAARTLVYDVSIYDPWTFIAGAVVLVAVSLAACWFPARRASRVDPMIALRAE
ncbi:MAG TPA: ABC transporter permease [Gemmatimonadaceae bacterium]|jgi:putative ABC transport system permease protein